MRQLGIIMNDILKIEANSLSFLVCLVLFVNMRTKVRNLFSEYKIILLLVTLVMSAVGLDILFWCLGIFHNQFSLILRSVDFFLYYIVNNLIPFAWIICIYLRTFGDIKPRVFTLLSIPVAISLTIVFINPFTGYLYRITPQNGYLQGTLFYINIGIAYFYFLLSNLIVFLNRRKINANYYRSIIAFTLPPFFGSIIQFSFGGLDLIWPCASISILIMYLGVLQDKLIFDYLTGLYNRIQLNEHIDTRLRQCTAQRTFSGIMLDIDNFKYINDNFGHQEGDTALKKVAHILKKCVSGGDLAARSGGDEFVIILKTDKEAELKKTAEKIRNAFSAFNLTSDFQYKLDVSMGYDVYKYRSKMKRREFLHHIDSLMYQNKRKKKQNSGSAQESVMKSKE